MAGYTRQSTSQIINGANITAPPLNAEFNQLASAFGTGGHAHDGQAGNGPRINLASSVTGYLPPQHGGSGGRNNFTAVSAPGNGHDANAGYSRGSQWYNYPADRWYICMDNTVGSAVWRELLLVETGSVLEPGITGAVDLGSTLVKFKDAHLAGTLNTDDAALAGDLTVGGTQTNTGAATFNGSATFTGITNFNGAVNTIANASVTSGTINGTSIGGATPASGTFTTVNTTGLATLASVDINGGAIDNTVVGATAPLNVTGTNITATTGFIGDVTGNVVGNTSGVHSGSVSGNVTGDLSGNVTTSTGTSQFNNVTINGSLDMDATTASTITGLSAPTNATDAATKAYVDQKVALVLSSAPQALDTLNELAAAINDDANFATTVNNSIATKLSLSGGTMTGSIDLDSTNKITNMPTPSVNSDGANKGYVDTQRDTRLALSGGTMTGAINMNTQAITSLSNPANDGDAANKGYVDSILGSATSAANSASTASALAVAASNSASNAQASEDEAQEWATKTSGTITGESEYSAKEYAIGTVIRGNIGSAKDWSTYTGGTVDGTNFSAKYWATQASVGTIVSNIDDINLIADDLSTGSFVAGAIYDFGSITEAASGTSGSPDGFIVTVADNITDVITTSTNISSVNDVAGVSTEVASLGPIAANITTVAGIEADVTTVAVNSTNVSAVAAIDNSVTAVANNNSNINTVAGQITPQNNVQTLASIAANISTVAGISTGVTDLVANETNVNTVASSIADVNALGPIASDISTVSGISSDVTNVVTNATNISTVASISGNVTTIANISSDVTTLSGISADITNLAPRGQAISDLSSSAAELDAVIAIQTDIVTVSGIQSDVTVVSSNNANVTTTATNIADINTLATDLTSGNFVAGAVYDYGSITDTASGTSGSPDGFIVTVANNLADVQTVAGVSGQITTLAAVASDIGSLGPISADITTAAANVADITNFADVYQGPKATAPATRNDASALQAGDLYFDTTRGAMRYYDGSTWFDIVAPTGNMSSQDSNNVNITGGQITGIDFDFGSIT